MCSATMPDLITDGPKAGRLRCVVTGCRRTFKPDGYSALICGAHYRLVDARVRKLRAKIYRQSKRKGWNTHLIAMEARTWCVVVRQATERALGL